MQKIKKILIGTHNKGKFKEISYLLSKKTKKFSPNYFKIKSPKETGKSFQENSLLKAKYFFKYSDMPSISDDSGLEVIALKKNPGIYSARWAKKYGSFNNAMRFILKKMKKKTNRSATFVCSLSIKFPEGKAFNVVGKIKGSISKKIIGTKGFGYDSIFIPDSRSITFGQMSKNKKIKIDHRYLAFKKLKKIIKTL